MLESQVEPHGTIGQGLAMLVKNISWWELSY